MGAYAPIYLFKNKIENIIFNKYKNHKCQIKKYILTIFVKRENMI